MAARETGGEQEHHCAYNFRGQWFAYARRVATQQVLLQLHQLIMRDAYPAEMSKAGVDAIDFAILLCDLINQGTSGLNAPPRLAAERRLGIVTRYRQDVGAAQCLTVDGDGCWKMVAIFMLRHRSVPFGPGCIAGNVPAW